jgi:hypothetical protein
MNERRSYPFECETDGLVRAAIAVCDPLDGVVDGIVSEPYNCRDIFNIFDHVGTLVDCPTVGKKIPVTIAAASVVNATWEGASTSLGRRIWHGLTPGANLTGRIGFQAGLAGAECTSTGDCTGRVNPMGSAWLRYFASKNESLDVQNLSREEFQNLVRLGIQEFSSFFATNDLDLTEFRDAGGRLLTWHGLVRRFGYTRLLCSVHC